MGQREEARRWGRWRRLVGGGAEGWGLELLLDLPLEPTSNVTWCHQGFQPHLAALPD